MYNFRLCADRFCRCDVGGGRELFHTFTDRQTAAQRPLFQDNLSKLLPERLNQPGF